MTFAYSCQVITDSRLQNDVKLWNLIYISDLQMYIKFFMFIGYTRQLATQL